MTIVHDVRHRLNVMIWTPNANVVPAPDETDMTAGYAGLAAIVTGTPIPFEA